MVIFMGLMGLMGCFSLLLLLIFDVVCVIVILLFCLAQGFRFLLSLAVNMCRCLCCCLLTISQLEIELCLVRYCLLYINMKFTQCNIGYISLLSNLQLQILHILTLLLIMNIDIVWNLMIEIATTTLLCVVF